MQIAAFSSSPGTISTQVIIDDDDISQQNLESHLLRACTARAWSVADLSRDCPTSLFPFAITMLLPHPQLRGRDLREILTPHDPRATIDSLDSASGYFDIGVFSSVCSVCVHFWGPPSAPALHTACVRRRQRARATGAGSPGALLHARILSYARLWVPKKPSWSTRRPGSRRDEPGPGGVRVGATRTDLDCRVVATSRRVAPTECDSRLPLLAAPPTPRLLAATR